MRKSVAIAVAAAATLGAPVLAGSDLPVTDGLVLHLRAEEGLTTDGGGVVTGWTDLSGAGHDAIAVTGDPTLLGYSLAACLDGSFRRSVSITRPRARRSRPVRLPRAMRNASVEHDTK